MNKPKLSFSAVSRVILNACMVLVLVVLASLIGVGGAALWIYSRPETMASNAKHVSPRLKADVAANEARPFPKLSPLQADDETPAQLTPARYVPTDSEIATFDGSPRYTYVSYNGGHQRAHLRVNVVVSESAPAPLAADISPVQTNDRPPLTDYGSRYITDAQGRVIGVDGTASAQLAVARALPVQTTTGVEPEVRVASPVVARKALPVDDEAVSDSTPPSFDVHAELAREDDRPVLRAQSVARNVGNIRPTMFGASDNVRSFGRY